jgi:ketosteroid isomerase-like protein
MEIVRRGYELFAADDLDAVAALFASDAELGGELGRTGISDDASTGPQRFLRAVAYAREHFDDYRIKTEQFLDADDAVIVGMRISYVRRDTGGKNKARRGHLWRLRDGLIVHGSDGYVAWVGGLTRPGLAEALTAWFGPPIAASS